MAKKIKDLPYNKHYYTDAKIHSIDDSIKHMLKWIGEDPDREGLRDTPDRVVASWEQLFSGYSQNVADVMTTFTDGACDEMVLLKDIEFYSTCLVGSTFVDTPRGRIPISRLQEGEFVYCWDEDACRMTIARAMNPRVTGKDQCLWRIYTDKDTILCTGDHKILTVDAGWVRAKRLRPGQSVVALNKGAIDHGGTARAYLVWPGLGMQIPEHRFVYQEVNGSIKKEDHIHHIDKRPNNNSPENLTALRGSRHMRLHRMEDGPTGFALFTDAQREAMRQKQIAGIRASQTEEVRKQRAVSVKRYWDSLSVEERAVRNHRVLMVEKTDWKEDVWCMDVPGYENFVANGMVVHNCEHHMLPFFGKAHIAYIPRGKVVGISKLARVLEIYSRRLQIQERLCKNVTDALDEHLAPKGAACILEAQHFCMVCRGVNKQNSVMVTSSLTGAFRETAARAELYSLVKG